MPLDVTLFRLNRNPMPSGRAQVAHFPTADALMADAAGRFVSAAAQATREMGRFVVALAGGSTPKRLYELLGAPEYANRVDWKHMHVFWGDERCVPPDDQASNYGLARSAFLERVPLPEANVHRIRGEDAPSEAAAAYEQELRRVLDTPDGPPSVRPNCRFDLVLLGMGSNGHTASLFPGLRAVRERERWVMAEHVAELAAWRITLTPPLLNAAAQIVFLVSGSDKAAMLRRVLEGPVQADSLPAQAIAPRDGVLTWLVDAPAAAELRAAG
jgi:6-phosphogluconolactonase